MTIEPKTLLALAALWIVAVAPARSQSVTGGTSFELAIVAGPNDMTNQVNRAKIEGMRQLLSRPTGDLIAAHQLQAIKNLVAIYLRPTTAEPVRGMIINVLLVDTVDAHPADGDLSRQAVETAETLYGYADLENKKVILARLGTIAGSNRFPSSSLAAASVLNKISSRGQEPERCTERKTQAASRQGNSSPGGAELARRDR